MSRLVLCMLGCAFAFGQNVAVTLKGIGGAELDAGSDIRIPRGVVVKRLEVTLTGVPRTDRVDLITEDNRLPTATSTQNGNLILEAVSTEPLGFFHQDEQSLQVLRMARTTQKLAEWNIARWKQAYIEASKPTVKGRAPDIELQQPRGGAFIFITRPEKATVVGTVHSQGEVLIRVDGVAVAPVRSGAAWKFTSEVPLAASGKEIKIFVQNEESGATRTLLLPIASR